MALRVAAHLPRLVVFGVAFALAGAALTYGAAKRLSAADAGKPLPVATTPTVIVPQVSGQAFTFAKGTLEDAGFAWQVVGSVQGYAANRVVSQSPAGGTRLTDTGAPTVTVTLARTGYAETGSPEDVSPYYGTAVVPAVAPATRATLPVAPASHAQTETTPSAPASTPTAAATTPAATTTKPAAAKPAAQTAAARPPAFVVAGAPKEPLKEMPLTRRAALLSKWLAAHPKPTDANVRYFLYQHAWVLTGAKFGWWHGAEALKLLIAADQRAESLWGIGHKSELAARNSLAEVEARTR